MTTLQGGGGGRSSKNAWLQRNKNAMRSASSGAAEKYDAIFVVVFLWGKLKTCTPMSLAPTTERIIIFECNWNLKKKERRTRREKVPKWPTLAFDFFLYCRSCLIAGPFFLFHSRSCSPFSCFCGILRLFLVIILSSWLVLSPLLRPVFVING